MNKIERRSIPVELRAKDDEAKISGYSILFDSLSENLGGFRERIAPDATIEYDDVVALFNHDSNFVLGRTSANTLTLKRDDKGLHMENVPPDTTWARDLIVSMRRGDIKQQSFAFRVLPGGQSWDEDADTGALIRTVTAMKIYDVSVVTTPAYSQTDASVRSVGEILEDRPQATGEAAPTAQADGADQLDCLRLRLDLSERE
jgi:HK97 family phage prohead protease